MGRLTLRQRIFAVAVGALLAAAQAASPAINWGHLSLATNRGRHSMVIPNDRASGRG